MWGAGATMSELCEALPRYSWQQIISQARSRKISRPKKPLANRGHPVIDQIKERARYLNLSMSDVDAMSGTKRYFYAAAGISEPTIARLESEDGPIGGRPETGDKLRAALERAGVEFIAENGGGAGVRMKRRAKRQA
jgi:hypothetical protein